VPIDLAIELGSVTRHNHGVKGSVYRLDSLDKCASTNALAWYHDSLAHPWL